MPEQILAVRIKTLFKIGDMVPVHGMYMCVPCGYVQEFFQGDPFTTCDVCLAGTDQGPEGYAESDTEFWELVS